MKTNKGGVAKAPVKSKPKIGRTLRSRVVWLFSFLTMGDGKSIRQNLAAIPQDVTTEKLSFLVHTNSKKISKNLSDKAANLIGRASNFRRKKALMKQLMAALLNWPTFLIFVYIPGHYACVKSELFRDLGFWLQSAVWIGFYCLGIACLLLTRSIIDAVLKYQVKLGQIISIVIRFLIVMIPHVILYYNFNSVHTWFGLGLNWVMLLIVILLDFSFLNYFCSEVIPDVFFYSTKIHLTEELILDSVYKLEKVKNWAVVAASKAKRNAAIDEIERLASLIEVDWSSHIPSGDQKTERWKIKTLRGIANGIRLLKRQLIIPGSDSDKYLKERFDQLFTHLLNNNLQGLIDANVPAERITKKNIVAWAQQFVVAILPLAIGIGLCKFFGDMVDAQYRGIFMAIGIGWLIVCVLLWLDPRLADKVVMMKKGKGILNPLTGGGDD